MKVTILGCGVYGLALANSFLDNKLVKVSMWNKFQKEIIDLSSKYLSINFTTDLKMATDNADLIVIAIPVAFVEETMLSFKEIYKGQDILIASKGIEVNNYKFAYEIVNKHLDNPPIGVISGGTFAQDMSDKKVMGLTLATKIDSIRDKIKKYLENDFIKIQYSDDIVGVSVCGSIKNVMAIGFGILDGAKYPPSSRFLFLTEAIYEIRDLIVALGGNDDTVMSYAGIDDIMMTCTSVESRNYTFGKMIGERVSTAEMDEYKKNTTIEGLGTSEAIYRLAKEKGIYSPISSAIYRIIYENADVNDLVNILKK